MKSVVLESSPRGGHLKASLAEVEDPIPGPGELVVDMEACGLCGTDLEKMRGEYTASMPRIGHEAVGRVASVGEGVTEFKAGDPIFPHHHVPCYECYLCRAGAETMCERYRTSNLDPGGFSESFRVPAWNVGKGGVLKLPDGMDFKVASMIEPLACCVRALVLCKVIEGDTVLVAGAGPVGMSHALLLREMGAKVIVSDVSGPRLELAEKAGVDLALNASREEVPQRVKTESGGRGADLAIVATGSKEAVLQGLKAIRKGGTVCLFGVPQKGSVLDYDLSELYNSGQHIVTSYAATEKDTKEALRILSAREEDFGALITHTFPLARFGEAVEAATSARAMKVVITP